MGIKVANIIKVLRPGQEIVIEARGHKRLNTIISNVAVKWDMIVEVRHMILVDPRTLKATKAYRVKCVRPLPMRIDQMTKESLTEDKKILETDPWLRKPEGLKED